MYRVSVAGVLFFGVPVMALALFVTSLILYLSAQRKNRRSPGTVPEEKVKQREVFLILTSIVGVLLLLAVVGFIGLLTLSVAFM